MSRRYVESAVLLGCVCVALMANSTPVSRSAQELALERVAELRDGTQPILARPWEIVQRSDRSFWVVDFSDRNIKVYADDGHRLETIGSAGRGPGQFGAVLSVLEMGSGMGAYDILDTQLVALDSLGSERGIVKSCGLDVIRRRPSARRCPPARSAVRH